MLVNNYVDPSIEDLHEALEHLMTSHMASPITESSNIYVKQLVESISIKHQRFTSLAVCEGDGWISLIMGQ